MRRERAAHGWTQEEAADRAGLNPRHLQKLEAGTVNVTIGTIEMLCAAFKVDVRRLFDS